MSYIWVIYNNANGQIVSTGGGSIIPGYADFGVTYRILLGITADPAVYRMNSARDGVEPIVVE